MTSSSRLMALPDEHKFETPTPLADGDFIISLTKSVPYTKVLCIDTIAASGGHITISYGSEVLHADPNSGGKVHLSPLRNEDDSSYSAFAADSGEFGSVLVLRFSQVIQASIKLTAKAVCDAKEDTPFTYYWDRRSDLQNPLEFKKLQDISKSKSLTREEKRVQREAIAKLNQLVIENEEPHITKLKEIHASNCAFYRAFRTAWRIQNLAAISKVKGLSCGNFAGSVFNTAIINLVFPTSMPINKKQFFAGTCATARFIENKGFIECDLTKVSVKRASLLMK